MSEPPRAPGRGFSSGQHRIAGHGEVVGGIAILEDAAGTIAMGLVAENVAYLCFVGTISGELASWCARRLSRLLERGCDTVFLDAHALEGGDVAARNAIFDALFFHSPSIPRVVCLVPAFAAAGTAGLATGLRRFKPVVTTLSAEFDELLTEAAPESQGIVTVSNCRRVSPSIKPPLKVVRSA